MSVLDNKQRTIITSGSRPLKPKPLKTRTVYDSAAPKVDHEANPPYTDGMSPTGERLNMKWFVPFIYGIVIGFGICLAIF